MLLLKSKFSLNTHT